MPRKHVFRYRNISILRMPSLGLNDSLNSTVHAINVSIDLFNRNLLPSLECGPLELSKRRREVWTAMYLDLQCIPEPFNGIDVGRVSWVRKQRDAML
jgi:hypothetical protein